MPNKKTQARLVGEIKKKFGNVIDLQKSPLVLVEILRQYGTRFNEDDDDGTVAVAVSDGGVTPGTGGDGGVSPGTGGDGGVSPGTGGDGGVSPGTGDDDPGTGGGEGVSAGVIPSESIFGRLELEEVLKAVFKMQKQLDKMNKHIEKIAINK